MRISSALQVRRVVFLGRGGVSGRALKTPGAYMKHFSDDGSEEERGERGAEHEADRFAEFTEEWAVINDSSIESEAGEEDDAD